MRHFPAWAVLFAGLICASATSLQAAPPTAKGLDFFEKKIRPVLIQQCYQCHSAQAKNVKAGLLLDTQQGMLKGGDSGAAIVPGDAEKSLLVEALKYEGLEMPPKGKLSDEVIADFVAWIEMGAPDPRAASTKAPNKIDIAEGRKFWAFQQPKSSPAPTVKNTAWPRTDIDKFVLAKLEANSIRPVADADRETLLRRVSLDLTGLPPTPEQIDAFVSDRSPQAFETVVDRLLASPQFGERWGRHWLDVARYGESTGKERNVPYTHAWRYRDYVIDAFNNDKPYDLFVREQIAGDLLPAANEEQRRVQRIATGFLALGPKGLNEKKPEQYTMDNVDEQIDTTSRAILGITVGCARCHDHKFDPIPTTDYYAMAGIFRSTEILAGVKRLGRTAEESALMALGPAAGPGDDATKKPAAVKLLADLESARKELYKAKSAADPDVLKKKAKRKNKKGELTNKDRRLERLAAQVELNVAQAKVDTLEGQLEKLGVKIEAGGDLAMAVEEARQPGDCNICIRGEPDDLGPVVPRGFVSVLRSPSDPKINPEHSGRLELAAWLTSSSNPLTARVMVNRIWAHLFGAGLVETTDNFGALGERPTHPELLDQLAIDFVKHGWSVKKSIRSIVLTRTYQLASKHDDACYAVDPQNHYLWRASRRRLDAEVLRDSLLAASGQIDLKRPEGSLVAQVGGGEQGRGMNVDVLRRAVTYRSVYLPILRGLVPEMLSVFDVADPSLVVGQREVTTVATQALYMMNSPFVMESADKTGARIAEAGSLNDAGRIDLACRLILGRSATASEQKHIGQFVIEYRQSLVDAGRTQESMEAATWSRVSQTLFASGEFRYMY